MSKVLYKISASNSCIKHLVEVIGNIEVRQQIAESVRVIKTRARRTIGAQDNKF